MKQLTVLALLVVMLSVTGCQALRGTTTPGNVAVAGEEVELSAENGGAAADKPETPADSGADAATSTVPPAVQTSGASAQPAANGAAITSDKAKEAALVHAGLKAEQVEWTKLELEKEHGVWRYDVKFQVAGSGKYEYEINADTGEVLSAEFDQHDGSHSASGGVTIDSASFIGEAKARQIALEMVPGAGEEHLRLKLDYDDGRALYEGEIHYGGQEYEFELDAASGAVLKWEAEEDD